MYRGLSSHEDSSDLQHQDPELLVLESCFAKDGKHGGRGHACRFKSAAGQWLEGLPEDINVVECSWSVLVRTPVHKNHVERVLPAGIQMPSGLKISWVRVAGAVEIIPPRGGVMINC